MKEKKIEITHYASVETGGDFIDLGESWDFIPLSYRPKALDMNDGIISVFDAKNEEFERIKNKSGEDNSKCMYGIEFLIWSPETEFAGFFFGSATSRRKAKTLGKIQATKQGATATSEYIKGRNYSWYGPIINVCQTPFPSYPEPDDVIKEVKKFQNPPESVVRETAPEESRER